MTSLDDRAGETPIPGTPEPCLPARFRKARLNPPEASDYLREVWAVQVAHATLNKLRCVGGGPRFEKFGRSIFYPRAELDAWVQQRLGKPLSSTSAEVS